MIFNELISFISKPIRSSRFPHEIRFFKGNLFLSVFCLAWFEMVFLQWLQLTGTGSNLPVKFCSKGKGDKKSIRKPCLSLGCVCEGKGLLGLA